MPSLPDTAVIVFLGLLLFGPKGLAKIARQAGKLMGEFRRASNEFRMQMEEELRVSEQADRLKEIATIEAAAPPTPALATTSEGYKADDSTEDHPHLPPSNAASTLESSVTEPAAEFSSEPLPIASSGDLSIMPPATGLPSGRSSSLASFIDSVPKVDAPGARLNGQAHTHSDEDQRSADFAEHDTANDIANDIANGAAHQAAPEESLHG